ncbi:nitroreductase family protein [Acidovorax sp.]|jgi:nitroreductase|uniref:nitroreductase family protein n=1 Tax=Acidovorax sp. TaxID=1872122 RepID=UPI00391F98D6
MTVIPWPLQPAGPRGRGAAAAQPDASSAWALLRARRHVQPGRLFAPGPGPAELAAILDAAAHVPDPGQALPWRLVLVPDAARAAVAGVCAQALPPAPGQPNLAQGKALEAPALLLAVVDAGPDEACGMGLSARLVSAGCALQNMLLMAAAQGYGTMLSGGEELQAPQLRALFGLRDSEQALCFLGMGTVQARKTAVRVRPAARTYVGTLGADGRVRPLGHH